MPAQIPLALKLPEALDRGRFAVGGCNQAALSWLERWPNWPGPALYVAGPPGAGKTHLCNIWLSLTGGTRCGLEDMEMAVPALMQGQALALDDADAAIGNRAREESLFHLFNLAREHRGWLLLTGARTPADAEFILPDLASRLRSVAVAVLEPPDDEVLRAMLRKLLKDRGLEPPDRVFDFMLLRMERSFAAARALIEAVDREALASKRAITVPLVSHVLASQSETPP